MLDILHHFTSGYKAYCTGVAYKAMDEMRQSCGGAGFHMASGIALIQLNNLGMVTYEGVNTVMMQQSSRFLLKQFKGMSKGKKCEGYMEYLNNTEELIRSKSSA